MNTPFRVITAQYDRKAKSYFYTTQAVEHITFPGANSICVDNGNSGFAMAIGLMIAGNLGPKEPAKRAAIMNGLLELMGSDRRVDTDSFSLPIIAI